MSKEKNSKINVIGIVGLILVGLSIASLWIDGYVDTYYLKGDRPSMSLLLLVSSVVALIGFVLCVIMSLKTRGLKKYLYIGCALLSLGVASLELVSIALLNSLN